MRDPVRFLKSPRAKSADCLDYRLRLIFSFRRRGTHTQATQWPPWLRFCVLKQSVKNMLKRFGDEISSAGGEGVATTAGLCGRGGEVGGGGNQKNMQHRAFPSGPPR
jgi:hypothetical protein